MPEGVHRLLRPAWVVSHLTVLALLVATVNLGLWQIRRLEDRRDHNHQVEIQTRQELSPVVTAVHDVEFTDDLRYRPVTATGTFDPERDVQLANRSRDGAPGIELVTPLVLTGRFGEAVAVNRGFVPLAVLAEADPSSWAPPAGVIEAIGLAMISQPGGQASGEQINRIDLDLLAERWDLSLLPVYMQVSSAESESWPLPLPTPNLGEGSHLSYAVQWFIFTLIGMVGYPLVLVRLARQNGLVA